MVGKRITELKLKIERRQVSLVETEDELRLEDRPLRKMQLQEDIGELTALIGGYQAQLLELRKEIMPEPTQSQQETLFVTNYPYGLEAHFVGREKEILLLDDWFLHKEGKPILAVIGLGGTGKSALTWKWRTRLQNNRLAPSLVVWWSFYETDGTIEAMLRKIFESDGINTTGLDSPRKLYNRFVLYSQQKQILIMLDGAERLLHAYGRLGAVYQGDDDNIGDIERARDCVEPVADLLLRWLSFEGGQTKTLLTSRLLPRALQGQTGEQLATVERHDLMGIGRNAAVTLFARKGIEASGADIDAVCAPLAYHPLSLRLLANWLAYNPYTRRDIREAVKYDVSADLFGKREHVLARVYESLTNNQQHLLGQMAALRSAIDAELLESAFNASTDDVTVLLKWGLVQWSVVDGVRLYDLHPIVRRYAYSRLTNRTATHAQLVTAFEAVPQPERITTVADVRPMIELYHHLAHAGRYDEACDLYYDRLYSPLYYQLGAYQTCIDLLRVLFVDGEEALPRLQKDSDQGWTLNELANKYLSKRNRIFFANVIQNIR